MYMKNQTLSAKTNKHTLVKPAEMIDVIEVTPLRLHDKRLFNELLANAWEEIGQNKTHKIEKNALKQALDKNLPRLGDSLERLMGTHIKTISNIDGQEYVTRFHFLARVDDAIKTDGIVRYKFSEDAEKLMANSTVFARLHREVMFALSSRYSLSLYEIISKRINLKHVSSEIFEIEVFRKMLGVDEAKYKLMSHLRLRVFDISFGEVTQLTNVGCSYTLVRNRGKGYTHIQVNWFSKDASAQWDAEKKRSLTKKQQLIEREEHVTTLRTADKLGRRMRVGKT